MKKISCCFLLLFLFVCSFAGSSDTSTIKISYTEQRINKKQVLLTLKVKVAPELKFYSLPQTANDALYSSVDFDTAAHDFLDGNLSEEGHVLTEKDITVNSTVRYVMDSICWKQIVKLQSTDSLLIKATVNYLFQKNGQYIPGQKELKMMIPAANLSADKSLNKKLEQQSLLWIFFTAFGGGLLALLTPCVYSMVPVTVSFFTKRSKSKSDGIKNALTYSLSLIVIFTLLGFLITLLFGPAALNNLATNWGANLIFFTIFLVFGFSFLGAFEIGLPSSWTNKAGSKSGAGSFMGIFFMALTLALVSFSCTGPIIGNLLVLAAKGSYWGPLTGMFGFSLALALPFALFAFFPSRLNVLGKAGGWLNAVKVTLGFIELALALKFLSNADLAKGWRILDREVFIAAWFVIFVLLGFYLLGKIKFKHDDALPANNFGHPHLSVTRLLFAIAAFLFSIYILPGLWGAPLKSISAFLPPMGTQDFVSSAAPAPGTSTVYETKAQHSEKYFDQMKMYEPEVVTKYGMTTYYDYREALAAAKKNNKPLMLDFTGINCVNCRKMEGQVWSDPKVMERLKNNFVIVSLYVDANNIDIPTGDQYFSKALNKQIETLGDLNTDMQVTRFGANTQPYYFFLDNDEQKLVSGGYGYDPDVNKFIRLLDEVKNNFDKNQQKTIDSNP